MEIREKEMVKLAVCRGCFDNKMQAQCLSCIANPCLHRSCSVWGEGRSRAHQAVSLIPAGPRFAAFFPTTMVALAQRNCLADANAREEAKLVCDRKCEASK